MDSVERNKIAGAVLASLLFATVLRLVAGELYAPSHDGAVAFAVAPAPGATPSGAPAVVEDIAMLLAGASVERGARAARKCVSCHTFAKGDKNKIGPNLWDIVNRQTGRVAGFSYSKAMREHGGQWTYDALAAFLTKPRGYVKGTIMSFAGLRKPQQRADVILYLRSLSDAPQPLP